MFRKLSTNREALTKLQVAMIIAVVVCTVVIGVSAWWVTRPKVAPPTPLPSPTPTPSPTTTPTPTPTPTPTLIERALKCVIKVEAEGVVLHYQNETFWDGNQFLRILEYKAEFKSNLTKQFDESLSRYGLHATSYEIEFDESRRFTLLKCDVHNAISKSGNRYTAEFEWLLEPLGLNLYDLKESNKELFCETTVNDTPTTFTLRFPASIGHCYYHVWWEI